MFIVSLGLSESLLCFVMSTFVFFKNWQLMSNHIAVWNCLPLAFACISECLRC